MRTTFVLVLVLSSLAWAQAPGRKGAPRNARPVPENAGPSAESLLRLAHDQAQELPAVDRATLLSRAIIAADRIAPDQVRPWTEELFSLMPEVPEARRASLETTPVIAVANQDIDLAMDLLERMDGPPEALEFGSDSRSVAASNIFGRYWAKNGPEGLDRMRAVAAHLGATGVYPYIAFFPALNPSARPGIRGRKTAAPAERDTSANEALFADLVQQFRASSGSYTEISEFERMLLAVRGMTTDPAYREGISLTLSAIDRLPADDLPKVNFTMSVGSGSASLDNAASVLLMRLMPTLKQVDPRWAQQVLDQHGDVAKIEQLRSQPSGGGPTRTSLSQAAPGRSIGPLPAANQLIQVQAMAGSGAPEQAIQTASGITDPAQRAAANAEIAAGLALQNPQQSAAYLAQAKQALDGIDDPAQKLRVVVSLAKAAYAGGDSSGAAAYTNQGFTLGEEVVRADYDAHPDKAPMTLKGASDLAALVATAMRVDAPGTVARISNIRYPMLRAHLMISAADAQAQRNARGITGLARFSDVDDESIVGVGGVVGGIAGAAAARRPGTGAGNPPPLPPPPE